MRGISRGAWTRLIVAVSVLGVAGCGGTAWSARGDIGPAPRSPAAAPIATGPSFADPQGTYTMTTAPTWDRGPSPILEVEVWHVGAAENGFTPNVNVLTQTAPGIDLAGYLALSLKQGRNLAASFHAVGSHAITGTYGQPLGVIEYTAAPSGRNLDFLAVIALAHGHAIVATLTAPDDSFAALQTQVEPYLDTLQAT